MPLNRSRLTFTIDLIDDGESVTLAELHDDSEVAAEESRRLFERIMPPPVIAGYSPRAAYDRVPTLTASAKRHPGDRPNVALGRNLATVRVLRKLTKSFEDEIPADCRDESKVDRATRKAMDQMVRELRELGQKMITSLKPKRDEDSNLVAHARSEMSKIGLYDDDADYGGMLAHAVEDLISVFAAQGHSGGSAFAVTDLFKRLASFDVLSPLTDDPDEWMHVTEEMAGEPSLYQSRRRPDAFSNDGGKTHYLVGDKDTTIVSEPHTKTEEVLADAEQPR